MAQKGIFKFKQFELKHSKTPFKIGTDGLLLGAWVSIQPTTKTILDIGAGCGIIAIMLAQRCTQAKIHAIELNQEAYEEAIDNAVSSPWSKRIKLHQGAVQQFNPLFKFDLIVSNPPYFENSLISSNKDLAKSRHTISLSQLDLLKAVNRLLAEEGSFQIIMPYAEGKKFIKQAKAFELYVNNITEVFGKQGGAVERLLLNFSKINTKLAINQIIIRNEHGEYSDEYFELTDAFHYFTHPNKKINE